MDQPATDALERMLKNGPDSGSQKAANAALAGTNNVPGYSISEEQRQST